MLTKLVFVYLAVAVTVTSSQLIARHGDVDHYYSHVLNPDQTYHNKNFGNEILYQIVVDRFANGNPANDCVHGGRYCARGTKHFLNQWYAYHGGDLRGVIKAIPYLKNLGVTRVWLTPIFENNHVHAPSTRGDGDVTSYHGYWVKDWYRLNPYFTDKGAQDYGIVNEMIQKGGHDLRFYLDTVANHTSPANATSESLDYLNSREPLSIPGVRHPHEGALFKNGKFITSFAAELRKHKHDPNYNPVFHPWNQAIKNWDNTWEVENLQLARLADFNQNNQALVEYLTNAHKFWLKTFPGLAGYRIDTIKHVPHGFWRHFAHELYRDHPKMEAFGEYWNAGTWNSSSHPFYNETRFSMLDFNLRTALERIYGKENASMHLLTDLWRKDGILGDARSLITFLDNHDLPRMRATGVSYQRMKQAVVTWMMSRGIPVIYYGLEQDLFYAGGPVGDPFNRPMMDFHRNKNMYSLMRTLIRLRRENAALRYGATHVVHETNHIIGFERVYNGQVAFVLTSTNPSSTDADSFFVNNLRLPNGQYRDILTGKVYRVDKGRMWVSIKNGEVILLTNAF